MKVLGSLYYGSILVFVIGLSLKLIRTPFHTIMMVVGLGALLVISVLYLIALQRNKGLLGLSTFFAAAYLLSVVKFWPSYIFGALFGFMVIIATVVAGITFLSYKGRLAVLVIFILVGLGLNMLPKHQLYYVFNIRFNYHIDADYIAWDKYSWFLYNGNRLKEAIQANNKAYEIVKNSDEPTKELILRHQRDLKANNWKSYQ